MSYTSISYNFANSVLKRAFVVVLKDESHNFEIQCVFQLTD